MTSEKNIAFLIQAHHKPRLLFQLVNTLQHRNIYFFIHIDKKSDINPFKESLKNTKNVYFINNRVKVNWGGFSQVQATLNLINSAISKDVFFSRYTLLSGCDLPIKPVHTIYETLAYNPCDYVSIDSIIDENSRFIKRITKRSDRDNPLRYSRFKFIKSLSKTFNKIIQYIQKSHSFYKDMQPYHGSQWWSLTHDSVAKILAFIDDNPDFIKRYKSIGIPDENFFQSLRANLSYSNKNVPSIEPKNKYIHGIHYIDWHTPNENLPKTLDSSDFKSIKICNALFARKFDLERSEQLIKVINSTLSLKNKRAKI